jgi:hypothetical protein
MAQGRTLSATLPGVSPGKGSAPFVSISIIVMPNAHTSVRGTNFMSNASAGIFSHTVRLHQDISLVFLTIDNTSSEDVGVCVCVCLCAKK